RFVRLDCAAVIAAERMLWEKWASWRRGGRIRGTSDHWGRRPLSEEEAMRIASFNVESLFERPVAMNPNTKALATSSGPLAEWKPGATVLDAFAKLNDLLAEEIHDDTDK